MSLRHAVAIACLGITSIAYAQITPTEAEVRKVDKATQSILLKHGEIKNLGMSPMTMAFKVANPSMLDAVKAGDKVRFTASMVNGEVTVTSLEQAK